MNASDSDRPRLRLASGACGRKRRTRVKPEQAPGPETVIAEETFRREA